MGQSIQKVIKIGSSAGVTIPTKILKHEGISVGDEVEVIIRARQKRSQSHDSDTVRVARDILRRYKTDFDNLAER